MTIPHFADQQNLVFVPALIALLIATVAICLPVVFAPALHRGRRGRRRGPIVLAGIVGAAALVVAGWQGGVGIASLQNERSQVQADIRARYGLDLPSGDVSELISGGAPQRVLPEQAAAVGLRSTGKRYPLQLKATAADADTYVLTFDGKTLPATA